MKILLNIFVWFFWKHLHWGMRSVTGYKTLAEAGCKLQELEAVIRMKNGLEKTDDLIWDKVKKAREEYARYLTVKHFYDIGELLALFKAVSMKKITGGYGGS